MTWEEIKSIIDKLVAIKCELKDVEYKLEFAWDDWVDYVNEDTIKVLEDGLKKRRDTLLKQKEECYSNIKDFVMNDTIVKEHEKKIAERCNEHNNDQLEKASQRVEELKKEREDLKAKIDNCCGFCQPIKDDPCEKIFDAIGYAVLIRLCVDILDEAKKYRPNITIGDIINGVNEGKIKLSLYDYDILSPNSGEKPKIEFVD